MNRFVSQRSVFFLLFAWVLLLTLFADGANIDDLCAGAIVLHDDADVTSASDQGLVAISTGVAANFAPTPRPRQASTKSDSAPATPVRVIVDQDSPSLAAEYRAGAMFESLLGSDHVLTIRQSSHTQESLYLRFCSLLI